ncbi:undecaprenyl-phosphate galactose phosphotransferase WbaP [Massilia forsythiae]|uniref:Undecaprenyl-phosphate galactose phosphotransferase WbaP n=1 Tax=Massilia forsythiae TaxID=2728020 RepID=A0A7Z2VXG2_9BURK|nr:undecaprenyl-phosphate galactose phosphotransferase WbaP [Massilia forsythiae]QJE00900.1 undecaprenyl-phosphate galactose phosphotransferase WbaP [Massilia forsythiae]
MKPIESIFLSKTKWFCSRRVEKALLICTDIISMASAFIIAVMFAAPFHGDPIFSNAAWGPALNSGPLQIYLLLVVLMVAFFWGSGHYSKRKPFANEIKDVLKITLTIAALDVVFLFLSKLQFSRASVLLNWATAPVVLVVMRWIIKRALIASGGWIRPMVIIGWGENAIETALAFKDEPLMGLRLAAFLVPVGKGKLNHDINDKYGNPIPCISLGTNPVQTLKQLGNPHVVFALEQGGVEAYQDTIQQLGRHNNDVQLVPALRGLPLYGMEANHFFAHEVLILTMRNNLARRLPRLIKRCFDLVVSASVLLLGSPLFLFIAFKVSQSGRPIFFGHTRVGQHNLSFKCYKFRTMAPNADKLLADLLANSAEAREEWKRDFKLKNDPRITSIGQFLRKTSLDEIPQLWNVLKGDMSLVGPRPVVTAELERYGNQVDYYLEAKPGVTGLWQISGRNDVSYDTRVYLDAWYVKNWSLFNDIVILLRTIKVIFRKDGAY